MIKYYKNIEDNKYICAICTGAGEIEISEEEFNTIHNVIQARPTEEPGFIFRLKTDLTWDKLEYHEEITNENEEEISHEEFMTMIEEVL